ncbi:hypothetical protein AN478_06920 [Thiohalorhabdus denitrificans]|nr:hypothetical protein [Thiohalorhabdus denitrificans]KPV39923.1 hypothetical protein AN478_06920 [Thiohalorhabdus denitrificans]
MSPELLRQGPPAEYLRLGPGEESSGLAADLRGESGIEPLWETGVEGLEAAREALLGRLNSSPLVMVLGDPGDPFVREQVDWLGEVLPNTRVRRALWVQPPSQPGSLAGRFPGPVLEAWPGRKEPESGAEASTFLAGALRALLRSVTDPGFIGVDPADLAVSWAGALGVFSEGTGTGPGRAGQAVRTAFEQGVEAGALHGGSLLTGAVVQIRFSPEVEVFEIEEAMEAFRECMEPWIREEPPFVVGAPMEEGDQDPERLAVEMVTFWYGA